MTSAYGGVVKEDGATPANAFDDGSGRVDLNVAGNPGLTFDESGADYVAMADQLWNSNYPSLYVPVMPGKITVERTVHSVLSKPSNWITWVDAPADVKVTVPSLFNVPAGGNYTFNISVDGSTVPLGETRFATLYMRTYWGKDMTPITVKFPITFVRKEPVVTTLKNCDPADLVGLKSTTNCTIDVSNTAFTGGSFSLTDTLPKQLVLVNGSLTGGTQVTNRLITASGDITAAQAPTVSIAPGESPAGGYLPLSLFGIAPIAGVGDETITNFNVPAFVFAGETYTRVGLVSDGYVVVGGGTGGDIQYVNQSLPDPNPPNNVLAPFWTDLNPGTGGAMRIATLTDGVSTWLVIDYDAVKEYSSANTTSFEIWIGVNGVEDISYAFGPVTGNGDGGFLTVGVENKFGNSGQNSYYNGAGTLPAEGDQLVVTSVPGQAGAATPVTLHGARRVRRSLAELCRADQQPVPGDERHLLQRHGERRAGARREQDRPAWD